MEKIVVYGCDNSGKTTAVAEIQKILTMNKVSCETVHSCGPKSAREQVEFMVKELQTNPNSPRVKVFDRFPAIEELVYGPIVRNKNVLKGYSITCDVLMNQIDLFIFCCPDYETISNWGDREQMKGVKENTESIILAYNNIIDVYPSMKGKLEYYDWKKKDHISLTKILKKREYIK